MCVEGFKAIPLGCSDCYDKENVPEGNQALWHSKHPLRGRRPRVGTRVHVAGAGLPEQGWLSPWCFSVRRLEEWQPSPNNCSLNT